MIPQTVLGSLHRVGGGNLGFIKATNRSKHTICTRRWGGLIALNQDNRTLRLRKWTCSRGRVVWLVSLVLSWYRRQELSCQLVWSIIRAGTHNIHTALDIYVTYNHQKKAKKWFKEHSRCSVPFGTLHPECSFARRNSLLIY